MLGCENMKVKKGHKIHESNGFNLDQKIPKEYIEKFNSLIVEGIKEALEELSQKARNCEACGSIQPELDFTYKNRSYRFVCWKMTGSKGAFVAETDYKRLGKYCQAFADGEEKNEAV